MRYSRYVYSFLCGLVLAIYVLSEKWGQLIIPAKSMIMVAVGFWGIDLYRNKRRERFILISLVILGSVVGYGRTVSVWETYHFYIPYYIKADVRAEGVVTGQSTSKIYDGKKYTKTILSLRFVQGLKESSTKKKIPARGSIFLFIEGEKAVKEGEFLVVKGKILPFTYSHLEGKINEKGRHVTENLYGQMFGAVVEKQLNGGSWWSDVRTNMRLAMDNQLSVNLPHDTAVLVKSLLLGADYGEFKEAVIDNFSRTGLIHILSVSGSHVSFILYLIFVIGEMVGVKKKNGLFLAIIPLSFYCYIVGFDYPVIRAFIAGIAGMIGMFLDRPYVSSHVLGITVIGNLLYNPLCLWDVSFQLSYAAAYGIALFYPFFVERIGKGRISSLCSLCISANLITLPFQLYYFHRLTFMVVVANLFIAPLLEALMVAGLMVFLFPNAFLLLAVQYMADFSLHLVDLLAHVPGASLPTGAFSEAENILYLVWICLAGLWIRRILGVKFVLLSGVFFFSSLLFPFINPWGGELCIKTFAFPREQVILCKLGKERVLYIGKSREKNNKNGKGILLKKIKEDLYFYGIRKINYMVVSEEYRKNHEKEFTNFCRDFSCTTTITKGNFSLKHPSGENFGKIVFVKEKGSLFSMMAHSDKGVFLLINGQEGKKNLQLKSDKNVVLGNGICDPRLREKYNAEREISWALNDRRMESMEIDDGCEWTFRQRIEDVNL